MHCFIKLISSLVLFYPILHFAFNEKLFVECFKAETCEFMDDDITIAPVSYCGCLNHCTTRSHCAAINFMQKMSLCRLNRRTGVTGFCHGYVNSRKEDFEKTIKCPSSSGQVCRSDGKCTILECPFLVDHENGKTVGNQYSVGKNVALLCNLGYRINGTLTRTCQDDGTWSGGATQCVMEKCEDYLVSGPDGVDDEQLTATSHWCQVYMRVSYCSANPMGKSARYGRINSTGVVTGCWSPAQDNDAQYIQVHFKLLKTITGIALKGRDPQIGFEMYVTTFRVSFSRDCQTFIDVTDDNDNTMIFVGNNHPDKMVLRLFSERKVAMCVRVHPVSWNDAIAVRFDVLGC